MKDAVNQGSGPVGPRHERWLLVALAGVQFTHILDFMIMMPLGPQLMALFGIRDAQFGLLVSAYTLAGGLSGLLAAGFIDRFGRRRLLLIAYLLFALATLACGLAPSYAALMAARVAAGLFGGVLSALVHTIVADVVPFERRGRAMGIVMTSFSVSTVAGVPLGLFAAAHLSWHAPFFGIAAISACIALAAWRLLPPLRGHVQAARGAPVLASIAQVLAERNHQRAFLFSGLLMFAGFTVIPYISIYLQTNARVRLDQIPIIYLAGGVLTLFSARWYGRVTDRIGKVHAFRAAALAATVPMVATTLVAGLPFWAIVPVSCAFFVCMSGRMIPGMALLTAAAEPRWRGTFMTLNNAVQSAAMGAAAFAGGAIISRDAQGLVQGYWMAALVGAMATLAAWWLAPRLRLHGTVSG